MKAKETLIAGASGTTFMTMFSYLVSVADQENYSEPERLGQLAHNLLPVLNKGQHRLVGWSAHYLVGMLFAAVYVELWHKRKITPTLKNTLIFGGISGLIAIAIWKTTFKMHPLPPKLSFNKYYLQLIPAHIVFAIFAGLGYNLFKKLEVNDQQKISII